MNKEDLYNCCIVIDENKVIEIQNILFNLGFNWVTSGQRILRKNEFIHFNYIRMEKYNSIYPSIYNLDVIYMCSDANYSKIISSDKIIRLFKIKKILE